MFKRFSTILKHNNLRDLFMEYFEKLNEEVPFVSAEVYVFPQTDRKINSFRFIKGRLYEKSFSYSDMDNTLVEDVFIDKSVKSVQTSDLFSTKSLAKDSYYFDLDANKVVAYPLVDNLRLNAIMIFLFPDELEIDLVEVTELINIKLSMINSFEEEVNEKELYKKILHKQKIYPYKIDSDTSIELVNHHDDCKFGETKVIKNDGKYYELTKIDTLSGYMADISTEIDLKISEAVAYRDQETKLGTLNKLMRKISENKLYSIIEIEFEQVYLLDVTKALLKDYSRSNLFISESSIYVYFEHSDKRTLNKALRLIRESLGNIMTFEYALGVVRVPNDVIKNVLKVLSIITTSDYDFYEKSVHRDVVNVNVSKKIIISKIKNQSYELKFHPIVNTKNQLEGYLVTHGIDSETIKDKRIELLITQYTLETIKRTEKKVLFFLDVSDELASSVELLDVLKGFRNNKDFFNNIALIFDKEDTDVEEYLSTKGSSIARRDISSLYKSQKKVDYIFQNIFYDDYSAVFMDFLSKLEGKGITPIFEVATKGDLQYVIDNKVGFVYTKSAQDVLIEKNVHIEL